MHFNMQHLAFFEILATSLHILHGRVQPILNVVYNLTTAITNKQMAAAPGTANRQNVGLGIPASQTLYVTNLNDKINKNDLRMALYTIFTTHGTVLDVVALKTVKMRGQAHIVFRDVNSAGAAMRALQGFNFLGKEMVSIV